MTTIKDFSQRDRALAPDESFIVQAPAGSGKTELLTQRFLVLLSHVTQPEEILAITFTKKAAAEMRARIIKTLQSANLDPEPSATHAKKTWQLARKALQLDAQLNWNLLANPNRLRIQTIDSFNASLTRCLPMLAHFGAPPDIADDPESLYREAVQEFLSHLEEDLAWSNAIALLLEHRNNDLDKVQTLLVTLLAKRDQWLPHITHANLRQELENHLADAVSDILAKVLAAFPEEHSAEFLTLLRYAADNVSRLDENSKIVECLDSTELPDAIPEALTPWQGVKELLFTQEAEWRKRIDKNIGFPPATAANNKVDKALYKDMKERMEALLSQLNGNPTLYNALRELHFAPAIAYTDEQWQVLNALYQVLRLTAAQLKVVFRQHGKIDYIENALAAAEALGTDEAPTDLALALDYQIKHILIDEFQDTSNSQFRLLEKLVAGWEPYDGRSLFIVGDPMQSIYRFREADVANFIRARNQGIANVKLESLALEVNFRSTPVIVDWVNKAFHKVLAQTEDIATGAISYSNSIANETILDSQSKVKTHVLNDASDLQQALKIVEMIAQARLQNPNASVAILVRARTHLKQLIPALKKASLIYRAIKIDPLNERAAIQDLMALTRALLNPADRVAWLAILRAPWCGLSLNDLLLIGSQATTIFAALQNADIFSQLSTDGKARLARVIPVLITKIAERKRLDLSSWIENTWLLLGGAATLEQLSELEDVNAYFNLLKKLDMGCDLADANNLVNDVNKLFAVPNNQADNTLQIMTIHNAKGLEFDTVIIPFLEKKPPKDKNLLLHWLEIPRQHAPNTLILAPLHATGGKSDSIYNYVKNQLTIKTAHETGRLLYVAATRAKKQLHLFLKPDAKSSAPDLDHDTLKVESLLKKLYPAIAGDIAAETFEPNRSLDEAHPNPGQTPKFIKRLLSHWQNPLQQEPQFTTKHQTLTGLQLSRETARQTGTVVHLILQQLSQQGGNWWLTSETATREQYVKKHLMQQGVLFSDLTHAIKIVTQAIDNTLRDTRGLWILQAHREQQSELALTAVINTEVEKLILDRTFVDSENRRWIIDYKTEFFGGGNLESFLNEEQARHSDKMLKYYNAMQQLDKKPVHLGLYFPLISAWREWQI